MCRPREITLLLLIASLAGMMPVALAADTPPSSPEEMYKAGAAAFQSGDYDAAAKNFEAILEEQPTGEALETILFTLASTYFNQKNLPKAEEYYNRYLKEFPAGKNKTKVLIVLSQIQKQSGRKAESEATLKKAAEGSGDLAGMARLAEAEILAEEGKSEEAAASLRPMIAKGIKDDMSVKAAMALVEIESKSGNLDEALSLLEQLQASSDLVQNPLQLDVLSLKMGDALLEKGERQKALRMYAIIRPKQVVEDLQKKRIETLEKTIADNTASLQKNPKSFLEVSATNARLREEVKQLNAVLDNFEKMPDTEVPVLLREAKAYDELDQKWETILIWESLLDVTKDPKLREDALFGIGAAYASLGRINDAIPSLDKYLTEFPAGKYASQAGYLKGVVALEGGDYVKSESVFGELVGKTDNPEIGSDIQFLLANSQFAQASDPKAPNPSKYKDAIVNYRKYIDKYPNGKYAEECQYRIPLSSFQLGDYANALEGFLNYTKKYPSGTFAGDCGYRVALCYQAANKHDEVISQCESWLAKRKGEAMEAEVLALEGDAYAAKEMPDKAADAYRRSVSLGDSEEILKYSLFQANTEYQKLNRWKEIDEMFSDFMQRHPEHPAASAAIYWVSKAKIKEGKPEEAKQYLAANIIKNINDRRKDVVEQLLTQLAQLCSKRPRPPLVRKDSAPAPKPSVSPASPENTTNPAATPVPLPTPTPLPPYDADADFAKYLSESNAGGSPLALARMRFALAQLAGYTKRPERQKELKASIYKDFTADQLSAMLLAECGQIALERGENDKAEAFFKELLESFPKSDLLEYAYCGMGEAELAKKQPAEAIKWFDDAVQKANADAKLADITFGKGTALLALGKIDEAKKIFEQVAATKEWRGEITARALLSLGELEDKRGKPDAALQYYQRVYVAYQRYPAVVIPAYLKAADAFVKLGKPDDAAKNLRDMLSKPRLAALPQAEQARKKLESLPPEPSPSVSPGSSPSAKP